MSLGGQQELILVICRWNLNPLMIPPVKIVIPTLQLLSPLRVFSSMVKQITVGSSSSSTSKPSNLYEALVNHLENQEGKVDLNQTVNIIYNQKWEQQNSNRSRSNENKNSTPWNFRLCILGEEIISWDIVMKFKLKGIVIDTFGENKRLQQISFATGGINKSPSQNQNISRLFLTIFSLSTECRKKFNYLSLCKDEQTSSQSIEFTVDCVCCKPKSKQLSGELYLCSKCFAVHCSKMAESCASCGTVFENISLSSKPC